MPQVLTTNATILCPHGGKGTSIASSTKVSIDDGLVLVENDTGSLSCPYVYYPCIGYQLTSMGLNSSVIDGRKIGTGKPGPICRRLSELFSELTCREGTQVVSATPTLNK